MRLDFWANAPDGVRLYAIGDIHGRLDLLISLMEMIERDDLSRNKSRTIIVFLGDYVDRGPDSKGVVSFLISLRERCNLLSHPGLNSQPTVHFLKGNHEEFLLTFLSQPELDLNWHRHGGNATLLSYGLSHDVIANAFAEGRPGLIEAAEMFRELLPPNHLQFFQALDPYYRSGNYFFVHAGINPRVPLHRQSETDLLWIREEFLYWPNEFEAVIVHGHSPVGAPTNLPTRIAIDTYAVKTGKLTAVGLEGNRRWFLTT